ncbi:MAG: signal peptidase II [Patescibacteria group bacterium]|nr:signal peptidase II [Patescibacteria group bacterium]
MTAGYMMIFSGLIGNAYDRIVYDAVRDWLDIIPHFPVFNIADVCISLGVSLILITEWRVKKKEENKKHTE